VGNEIQYSLSQRLMGLQCRLEALVDQQTKIRYRPARWTNKASMRRKGMTNANDH